MTHAARRPWIRALSVLALASVGLAQARLSVSVAPGLLDEPYTGRVYVAIGQPGERSPLQQLGWIDPPPLFAVDVEAWDGAEPLRFPADPLHHPTALSALAPGDYAAQAFLRLSRVSPDPGRGAGDLVSAPQPFTLPAAGELDVALTVDQVVAEAPTRLPEGWRLVELRSEALSAFHGFDHPLRFGLRLPKGWSPDDERRWPVLVYVTGFGGGPEEFTRVLRFQPHLTPALDEVIVVTPDARNRRGHSVFADSANTGPWGHALVHELLAHVDAEYGGAGPAKRYVTGISSGGWSSLWLQVAYPDAFAGVWSHVPDPVDFRDFQNIDLYAEGANMYRDEDGERRPVSRPMGPQGTVLHYDDFVGMETVLGPGGQIHSFEAVFSPRGADGTPRPLFDRATGAVDPEVAKSWEPYDIRLKLAREWETLGPKLAGKLHVYAGELDTFHLEGAVELLKAQLAELGSDAEVEVIPGMPHRFAPGKLEEMLEQISGVELAAPAGR